MIIFGFFSALLLFGFLLILILDVLAMFHIFIPIAFMLFLDLIIVGIGLYFGTTQPVIKTINLKANVKKPVTILQLSDLHVGTGFSRHWLEDVVRKANRQEPDIIVITGDLLDGHVKKLRDKISPLFDLRARKGVFMVLGNHEYYWGAQEWKDFFDKSPITLLLNKSVDLGEIVLGGFPIPLSSRFNREKPDISKTFSQKTRKPKVLMAHYPVQIESVKNKVFLQLSGHTHGGQIFFPFNLLTRKSSRGYLKGLYRVGGSWLYVNSGTGLWGGFPIRLGTLPEITIVKILDKNRKMV